MPASRIRVRHHQALFWRHPGPNCVSVVVCSDAQHQPGLALSGTKTVGCEQSILEQPRVLGLPGRGVPVAMKAVR